MAKSLNRQLDLLRGRSLDAGVAPFKVQYEPRVLTDTERSREPVRDHVLLARYLCVHGVPYKFRDSRLGCRKCGSYAPKPFVNPRA